MEVKPDINSEMTYSQIKVDKKSLEMTNSPPEIGTGSKMATLLCSLMKIGWKHLFFNYFTLENSPNANMELVDWLLRGEMDNNCNENKNKIRAWKAVQWAPNFNSLLLFLRKSKDDINFVDEYGQTIIHSFLRSSLCYTPKKISLNIVEKLIESGVSVDAADEDGYTCLHIAAEIKEKDLIKMMLPSFTNVSATAGFGADTVLHDVIYACQKEVCMREDQYLEIVRTLLSKGADPNKKNLHGLTPVQLAVEYNFFRILQTFQVNGADFFLRTDDDDTMIHLACKRKKNSSQQLKIIKLLVKQGCDVNAANEDGYSPLHYAAELRCMEVVKKLIHSGANVQLKTKTLRLTPLHVAALFDQPSNINLLLRAGADVNAEAVNGVTPLHIAASKDGVRAVKYLLEYGADVHRREKTFNFTALHLAVSGCKEKIDLLLEKGADVQVTNENGINPLHLASLVGNVKAAKTLIEHGVDVNCRCSNLDLTALHLASMRENTIDVISLVFANADLRNNNLLGMLKWIFDPTINRDNVAVAELLIKNGIDVNVKDAAGRTSLHLATLQPKTNMIEPLLKLGAYVDELDDQNQSPLHNVLENGNAQGLKCLLKFGLDIDDVDVIKNVTSSKDKIVGYVLAHAKKLCAIDLPIDEIYKQYLHDLDTECISEIKELKSCLIANSDNSLYDFLHMKPRRRSTFVKRVMSMNLELVFPKYCNIILASCHASVNRVSLLRPAQFAFNQITNTLWPEVCIEKILPLFNNRCLRALIDSADI